MREVVIVGAARTPIGSFQGELAPLKAPELGKVAIVEALKRAGVSPNDVNEVLMGCVLPAGVGQAPARQASIFAGLPKEVPCTTINKVCGSGLKAVMLGAQAIMAGEADVVVAGGMESMSNVPYYLPTARTGMRMGNQSVVDGMIHDGLWDVYNNFHMGTAAELCARDKKIDRAAQDAYAIESFKRALQAQKSGAFKDEIVAVEVPQRKGAPKRIDTDEGPGKGDIEKIPTLKPAFQKDGTVTAGNASTINDGAAAVIVCGADVAQARGWKPLARIRAMAQAAQAPEWFTTAPAISIDRALAKAKLSRGDIDLYEINEAFAVVAIANNQLLELDPKKVNVHGGAVALGHPIGASGARLLTTLLYAMQAQGKKRGVASLCIGGGEAVAVVVERP
ncbi:MAG: acetyl-CoA C-acyltransferase [Myxococcales bacterium]|nr:acetyl-CoA C-acyltransferase [Myxococcales bacterium]